MSKLEKILKPKVVVELTGLSRPTLKRMEDKGEFPRRVLLTETRYGYRESEIAQWIAAL